MPRSLGKWVFGFLVLVVFLAGCTRSPASLGQTCVSLQGFACLQGQTCSGSALDANDASLCCSVACTTETNPSNACARLNGDVCRPNEVCKGTWLNTPDSNRCCSMECQDEFIPGGDPAKTCVQQGRDICSSNQVCLGQWSRASDSARCCTGGCQTPTELFTCEKLVDNGSNEDKINVFLISEAYPSQAVFEQDAAVVLDWNALNNGGNIPHGIFFAVPFRELRDRFNVWQLFSTTIDLNCRDYSPGNNVGVKTAQGVGCNYSYFSQLIEQSCGAPVRRALDKTVFVVNGSVPAHANVEETYLVVGANANNPEQRYFPFSATIHEFGHLFDLGEEYLNTVLPITIKDDNLFARPNLDLSPGCPKWCSGELNTQAACYPAYLGWKACTDAIEGNPREKTAEWQSCWNTWNDRALQETGNGLEYCDLGLVCMEGTGCFFGATNVLGWRSTRSSAMRTGGADPYGPFVEQYLRNRILSETR